MRLVLFADFIATLETNGAKAKALTNSHLFQSMRQMCRVSYLETSCLRASLYCRVLTYIDPLTCRNSKHVFPSLRHHPLVFFFCLCLKHNKVACGWRAYQWFVLKSAHVSGYYKPCQGLFSCCFCWCEQSFSPTISLSHSLSLSILSPPRSKPDCRIWVAICRTRAMTSRFWQ